MNKNLELRNKLSQIVSTENEDNWWKPELFEKNTKPILPKELEIIENPPAKEKQYNCFIYAFGLQKDSRFLDEKGWIFNSSFIKSLISRDLLQKIENPKSGDVIFYEDNQKIITHSGIVEDSNYVISKWSWGPIIKHKIWDIPSQYGDVVFYCQKPDNQIIAKIINETIIDRDGSD